MQTHRKQQGASIAVTIAGSDSGGGAGIQADLKAFSALGVYGCSVITAVTAQNTQVVTAVHDVPADIVTSQIEAVLANLNVGAIKIGMLFSIRTIEAVVSVLKPLNLSIVVDPVMVAKSGDRLLSNDATLALKELLLPIATILTPNLPEAADLLALRETTTTEDDGETQAAALLALGPAHVLMKGGHAEGAVCVDLLASDDGGRVPFEAPRFATKNTHGTGCTLLASIAAGLAKGFSVEEAVREAHAYLQGAIAAADNLYIGSGHGPVHHFHRVWS